MVAVSLRITLLVASVTGVAGCSRWESNTVVLPAKPTAPVVLEEITMRHTLSLGLGGEPSLVSSTDAPNAMSVNYNIRVARAVPPHASVSARVVCRAGERALAGTLSHDAGGRLRRVAVGDVITGVTVVTPTAFHTEIPTQCETEFFYVVNPPLPHGPDELPEERVEVSLGMVCLSDGKLATGGCDDDDLGRTPSAAPFELAAVEGRIATLRDGSFGVAVATLATVGEEPPPDFTIGARAECATAEGRHGVALPFLFLGGGLKAGESLAYGAHTPNGTGIRNEPTSCDVTFELRAGEDVTPLPTYCVRGQAAALGACD